jgi:DNA primase
VLGTTGDYFAHYKYGEQQALTLAHGKPFSALYEVVLGAEVAEKGSSSTLSNKNGDPSGLQGTGSRNGDPSGSQVTDGNGNREVIQINEEETNDSNHSPDVSRKDSVLTGIEEADGNDNLITMQSDRPRLMAREQELQHQMRKLGSKRFLFGQGPERMQINTELMKLAPNSPK